MIKKLFSKKEKNLSLKNKKIVCIGGGTGQFSLLSGLKKYATSRENIYSIVTTLDNGGSSGKLITQYGVLPPGDIRSCMVALSDETELLRDLFQYRFDKKIDNHNFGNLLLTALNDLTGDFAKSVKVASKILRIRGEVIPVSLNKNTLIAQLEDGRKLEGETLIDTTSDKKIKQLYLKEKGKTNKRAVEVLRKADVIVFGPGDLYTSILPNLLFPNIRRAINENKKAKKVLVSSVMSKPGETDDFNVSHFKIELEKYLEGSITHVVANTLIPATNALKSYYKEGKYPILLDKENLKDIKIIGGNFIDSDKLVRHSPDRLAKSIVNLI